MLYGLSVHKLSQQKITFKVSLCLAFNVKEWQEKLQMDQSAIKKELSKN